MYKLKLLVQAATKNWKASLTGMIIAWAWVALWALVDVGWPDLPHRTRFLGMACTLGLVGALLATRLSRLKSESLTDPLTGLPNRRAFEQQLERSLSIAQRHGHPSSLVLIDLDGFKTVNDTRGHPEGDRLLQEVGRILTATIRKGDIAARLGGDEFALILPQTPEQRAHHHIKRLRDQIRTHCGIHISVGIASHPRDGETGDALLGLADQSLYRHKTRRC